MRKEFTDQIARMSKPAITELDKRNRESGLSSSVRTYSEELDPSSVPPGAVLAQFVGGVPQLMAIGPDGKPYYLAFGPGIPIGSVTQWAGTNDPVGGEWFICNGRLLDASIYPELAAACGSAYNTGGEVAGTFRIPDMRSRSPVGAGQGTGLTNRVIGARFGAENHTLGITEIPAHSHTASGGSHTHSASFSGGNHSHGYSDSTAVFTNICVSGTSPCMGGTTSPSGTTSSASTGGSVSVSSGDATPNIADAGGGLSHNNISPSLAIGFIIRAL